MTAESFQPIEAISLDFYGTLIYPRNDRGRGANLVDYLRTQGLEPAPYEHQMLYEIFDRHDTDYSPGLPEDLKSRYLRRLAARALDCLGIADDAALAEAHADPMWKILGPDSFTPYPDTLPVLAALKERGYPLVLVSNWQRGLANFAAELGLADAFDHLISSAELGIAKPDRGIFVEACERLGVAPDRVLHVGDTRVDDYEGGREAGLRSILLYRSEEPAPADAETIADLHQLLPRLEAS